MNGVRLEGPALPTDLAETPPSRRAKGKEMLGRLWARWKVLAQRVGDFQARVILTILYFVILGPTAMLVRLMRDPLNLKRPVQPSTWVAKPAQTDSLEAAKRQF